MKKLLLALTLFIASDAHAICMEALDACITEFNGYCNGIEADHDDDKDPAEIVKQLCYMGAQRSCSMSVTKKFGEQVCAKEAYEILKKKQTPPKEQHKINDHSKYEARYER